MTFCKKNSILPEEKNVIKNEGVKYKKSIGELSSNTQDTLLPKSKRMKLEFGAGHLFINN